LVDVHVSTALTHLAPVTFSYFASATAPHQREEARGDEDERRGPEVQREGNDAKHPSFRSTFAHPIEDTQNGPHMEKFNTGVFFIYEFENQASKVQKSIFAGSLPPTREQPQSLAAKRQEMAHIPPPFQFSEEPSGRSTPRQSSSRRSSHGLQSSSRRSSHGLQSRGQSSRGQSSRGQSRGASQGSVASFQRPSVLLAITENRNQEVGLCAIDTNM
jgi:hypothetical protein